MITVWGEGRGFRVIWLLEEMGLPYRLRDVDLLTNADEPEFLAVNPGGFIPAIVDGDTVMVESVAIMQYLMAKYGPTSLALEPGDPGFADYLQFLHLGESGLMGTLFFRFAAHTFLPQAERDNATGVLGLTLFQNRMKLVLRQLERTPYFAGDRFTAADIVMTYSLEWAHRQGLHSFGEAERAYLARTTSRDGYGRAMQTCQGTRRWVESMASSGR